MNNDFKKIIKNNNKKIYLGVVLVFLSSLAVFLKNDDYNENSKNNINQTKFIENDIDVTVTGGGAINLKPKNTEEIETETNILKVKKIKY